MDIDLLKLSSLKNQSILKKIEVEREQFMSSLDKLNDHLNNSTIDVVKKQLSGINFNNGIEIPYKKHPLIIAIKLCSIEFVSNILQCIQSIKLIPLVFHTAVRYGNQSIIDLLVERGVNINEVDENGDTVLHKMCESHNLQMMEYLILNKADCHVENLQKLRPIHVIVKCGFFNAFVHRTGIDLKTDTRYEKLLHFECAQNRITIIRALLTRYNIDIEIRNDENQTPIYFVRTIEVADMFIARNVKIDIIDVTGRTPLHKHCLQKTLDIAVKLLLNNLDIRHRIINEADIFNSTPLHYLFDMHNEMEMVNLFLKHDAKLQYDHPNVIDFFESNVGDYLDDENTVEYGQSLIFELIKQNSTKIKDILLMKGYNKHAYARKLIEQLKLMNELKIINTKHSYFTVFKCSIEQISQYMNDSNIVNIPNFSEFLEENCSEWKKHFFDKYTSARLRHELKQIASDNWFKFQFVDKNVLLNKMVIGEILSYLDNSDLNNFNKSFIF